MGVGWVSAQTIICFIVFLSFFNFSMNLWDAVFPNLDEFPEKLWTAFDPPSSPPLVSGNYVGIFPEIHDLETPKGPRGQGDPLRVLHCLLCFVLLIVIIVVLNKVVIPTLHEWMNRFAEDDRIKLIVLDLKVATYSLSSLSRIQF